MTFLLESNFFLLPIGLFLVVFLNSYTLNWQLSYLSMKSILHSAHSHAELLQISAIDEKYAFQKGGFSSTFSRIYWLLSA
jgi:hypothetical protein